jgi:hypothetical protein
LRIRALDGGGINLQANWLKKGQAVNPSGAAQQLE